MSESPNAPAESTSSSAARSDRVWWLPVVRGIALLVLGLVLMVVPEAALETLIVIFAAFTILDGVIALAQGLGNRKDKAFGWWLAQGAVSIVIGIMIILWPSASLTVLFVLLAIWVMLLGILGIIASVIMYQAGELTWTGVLTFGLVAFLFGLLLLVRTEGTVVVLATVYGLFAFVAGAVLTVNAFASRSAGKKIAAAGRVVEG